MRSHARASSAGSTMRRTGGAAIFIVGATALATLVFLVASASAAKEVIDYFGNASSSGSLGGQLSSPRGIAVNTTGAGPADAGDIYVAEEFNNRIQRFDSDGDFVSAWGADVIQAGKPGDQAGTNPFELCTVAADCKAGVATGGNGATTGNGALSSPQSVAVDNDTGNVYVSDRDNFRVNEYTGAGVFIRSFGFDADATEAPTTYEVCPAANACKAGVEGAGAGQVGSTFAEGGLGIAVSPADGSAATGTLFLADTQNQRVNTYGLDGTSPSSFGSSTEFGSNQPRKVAVDSRGIVYASNSNNGAEIERYDTQNANSGGIGFLAPILAADSSPSTGPLLAGFTTATSGLAVDPDSDAGGPDEDVLYVLRDPSSGNTAVQQFGPTNDPGLTAAPTAVDDTHGAGAGFSEVNGLGLNDQSGQLFVSSTGNVSGTGFASRVYILDNSVAPGATLDPVTEFDAHAATFSGAVDPNGAQVSYRFEYVDNTEFLANGFTNAAKLPLADPDVGNGNDPVVVEHQTPDHLVAGTLYHVRLVAKQVFSATQTIGGPLTFTTDSAGPSINGAAATVSTDEATLRGTINPENEATSYHFEWGATASYGNTTPVGNLPAGKDPVAIFAVLGGLTPGQTYHYRLVAENDTDETLGPDRVFTTYAQLPPLGPERAYELVSHYPSGGVPISPNNSLVSSSEDGDRVHFGSVQPLPGSELFPPPDQQHTGNSYWRYGSVRGPDGWQLGEYGLAQLTSGAGPSADGTNYLSTTSSEADDDARLDPDDQNGEIDVYQRQPDGSLVWISRDPRIPAGTPQTASGEADLFGEFGMGQMSADGSTVVFASQRQLSDADTTPDTTPRIYKWTDGQLSFIGIRPDGSVPAGGSALGASSSFSFGLPGLQNTVSRDGSRVVFSARRDDSGESRTLYIQTDGEPSVEAMKETGVAPLPASQLFGPTYRGGAADLSRVFFSTRSRLTPDSGAAAASGGDEDLYVYDIDADRVRDLTPRLDGLEEPTVDPATADRGRVLGLVANSEDGKRVYFVADAQYDVAPSPEGELPSAAGRNLYLAELDGIDDPIELRFIATLGAGDDEVWKLSLSAGDGKASSASPDGSVLGFGSSEALTGQALGGTSQLFVYDAEADTLECASCPTDGSLPAGNVNIFHGLGFETQIWQTPHSYKRWVSSDGRVFFHTPSPLLAADANVVDDVYEYRAGQLRLISAGTGTRHSSFEDASRDGSTVLFTTLDTLVPEDEEPGIPKLYAARVGGGFPFNPKLPPCDLGAGACEGAGTSAAEMAGAGSAAFEGPGNRAQPDQSKRCPKGKRKVRRKGKARCVPRKTRKSQQKRNAKHDRRASR